MAVRVICCSLIQLIRLPSTKLARLIDPRLQASLSSRGTSPQGLTPVSCPNHGVGFASSALSIKYTPGSPVFHALSHRLRNIWCSGSLNACTFSMNLSVQATLMLKVDRLCGSLSLHWINSHTSGWSQ